MIYNTILVHLGIYNGAAPQLKFARELASRFDANLIGFAAGDIHPITAPPPGVILDDEFLRLVPVVDLDAEGLALANRATE